MQKSKHRLTPEQLKLVFANIDEVFSWRDDLVQNTVYDNSDLSSPSATYDTFSVCSTPWLL